MSLTYPNPNLLFTYATAVLAQPHTRSRTTEPGPFASQSQPYASPSGRCRRADGAAAARAGGPRTAQRPRSAASRMLRLRAHLGRARLATRGAPRGSEEAPGGPVTAQRGPTVMQE